MKKPLVDCQGVDFTYPEAETPVFQNLSVRLEPGVWSLIGQNGTGKSTFLLLASGRLFPDQGTVELLGRPTGELEEEQKQALASVVYQNMEFETEDRLGDLLEFVFSQGFDPKKDPEFLKEIIGIFELGGLLGRKTQVLSKGEMQRAIMAFSLLYGSQAVFMDEPVFALEPAQKEKALEYLSAYARSSGRSFLYSVHELELGRKYADHLLLFHKNGRVEAGSMEGLFTREHIEAAYQVPYDFLHKKESLYREKLLRGETPDLAQEVLEKGQIL